MTALLRTSTEMPDEQGETGFLDGASLTHRLSDNECGQGELDSLRLGALWSTDQWASNVRESS